MSTELPTSLDRYLRNPDTLFAKLLLSICDKRGDDYTNSQFKRNFDLGLATLMATISFPVLATTLALVYLDDHHYPLFTQGRLVRGQYAPHYKVRTMSIDADAPDKVLSGLAARQTTGVDPRITRMGRLLRRYDLEELPQLWQVMTHGFPLVAPRAISDSGRARAMQRGKQIAHVWSEKMQQMPRAGIFNLFAVRGADPKDNEARYRYDIFQAENASLGLDVYILLRGMYICLSGQVRG